MIEETARCNVCLKAHPATEFHKNKSKKVGRHNMCKTCTSVYKKASYLRTKAQKEVEALNG